MRALDQTSQGHLDRAGFAPDRFIDKRLGRSAQTATFERNAGAGTANGRIRYSDRPVEHPLSPGTQDRLSWMLQLAAIAQARTLAPGDRLSMYLSGARGDASVWNFKVLDRPTITVQGRPTPTLHLQRVPRDGHDSRADVWLDPARHHLPVQATLGTGDDAIELILESLDSP
jgi:hypothetical protein